MRPVPELEGVSGAIGWFWWSLDGRWIVYSTGEGVWKAPTGGGAAERLAVGDFVPTNQGSIIRESGIAWPTSGRMERRYYRSARPDSFPPSLWVATEYGRSRSPNGRTELYSNFVAVGADLMLVDHFK